jgi:hypothetical protein
MTLLGTVIESKELASTVVAALAAGIGVTAAFSIMILGAARFADLRRDDRPLLAGTAAVVMVLGFAITVAGIVVGIIVMTSK